MIFQAMFAIITPALIIGAFAERMKFSAFLIFTIVWSTIVYDPVCHWVWGLGGWIRNMGALDFAGGTVVHVASGIAALAAAIVLGKRKNVEKGIPPHNLVFVVTGAALLWFGWFGFNAGSALGANGLAANAFVVTHIAASAAAVMYMILEWMFHGKPTVLGTATGAVAGLVAITPAAGFVGLIPSILIGIMVSIVCYFFVTIVKVKLGYDDALDAFGVHGVGGTVGAILTGVFASTAINPAGFNGLLNGNANQVVIQLIATGVTMVYSFIVSLVILKVIDWTIGLRVTEKVENVGLDLSEHHETAYTVLQ
jgi:Amt family ammonium transporter